MLRVLMATDTFLPVLGGAEMHVLELSRALRRKEVEVHILTSTPGPDSIDGFPVTRVPQLAGGSVRTLPALLLLLPRFARLVRGYHIIHCHYTYQLGAALGLVARLLRRPVLHSLHGLGTLDSSVSGSVLRRAYRRISFFCSDLSIATSEEMGQVARRFVNENNLVQITNGVDTRCFSPERACLSDPTTLTVLSMRRLAPKNGVQFLIEAMPRILAQFPTTRFLIAGEEKLEQQIRKRVMELGVTSHVKFIGLVRHEETKDYYNIADIVVFPSSAESTSLACLEALSMERIVVASALGAYKQMLGEGERGYLVDLYGRETSDYSPPASLPEAKIHALADTIITAVRDRASSSHKVKAARAFVQAKFDWRVICDELLQQYERLCPLRGSTGSL